MYLTQAGSLQNYLVVWILVFLTFALVVSGMPLFAGLGWFALILTYFFSGREMLVNLFIDPLGRLTQNDMLLPIPLFVIMGYIIARSKTPERLVKLLQFLMQYLIGRGAFSVGIMAILVSVLFTPLTGASGVTIVALGGILMPMLGKASYPDKIKLGIITSSGSLGLLFFPSIPVIIYGIVSNNKVSITDLFRAGILPGMLLILLPSIYVFIKAREITVNNSLVKYSDVKKDLFARMWEYFRPAREKRKELEKDPREIRNILKAGAEKARAKAAPTLDLVRERVGLKY